MTHSVESIVSAQLARADMNPTPVSLPVGNGEGTQADLKEKAALAKKNADQAYRDASSDVVLAFVLSQI